MQGFVLEQADQLQLALLPDAADKDLLPGIALHQRNCREELVDLGHARVAESHHALVEARERRPVRAIIAGTLERMQPRSPAMIVRRTR